MTWRGQSVSKWYCNSSLFPYMTLRRFLRLSEVDSEHRSHLGHSRGFKITLVFQMRRHLAPLDLLGAPFALHGCSGTFLQM